MKPQNVYTSCSEHLFSNRSKHVKRLLLTLVIIVVKTSELIDVLKIQHSLAFRVVQHWDLNML